MSIFDTVRAFPNIALDRSQFTSPTDTKYNCIAWAAGFTDKWWWPDDYNYWPSAAKLESSVDAFIQTFSLQGYSLLDTIDTSFVEGIEKVAIYCDNNHTTTHMSRQLDADFWTSKLGESEDISHHLLSTLEGAIYGKVCCILARESQV